MPNSKVVIIGGGFAGISMTKVLLNKNFDILLIDKHNYHTFQPLLYQVATGGLEPDSIAYPIRRIFRGKKNFSFRMAEVKKVIADKSYIETSIGQIPYDYLIIATGSESNYFNFEPIKNQLMSLKSLPNALDLRSMIMQNFEAAIIAANNDQKQALINIAIVGAGPTGVELAGALAEMRKYVLPKDYPELDFSTMHIYVLEAGDKVLSAMSEKSSQKALVYLHKLNVNVKLNTKVVDYKNHKLIIEDGTQISVDTVIWTAGVKGNTILGINKETITSGNRIKTDRYNKVEGYRNIFAIGDIASMSSEKYTKGYPMLAQVAIQQGKLLSKNLVALSKNKPMRPFKYNDKGSMATIGRNKAVVDLPFIKFQGTLAWMVWMFVHILSLVGFRNKAIAFVDWTSNYFTYDRALGLIIRPFHRKEN